MPATRATETAATDMSFRPGYGRERYARASPFVACSWQRGSGSESLRHRSGEGSRKGWREGRPGASRTTRGYLWFGCAMTLGKAQVMGIRGKPSTPGEPPYSARQSGPDAPVRRVCRGSAAAWRLAGSDRSNRAATLNAAPPAPVLTRWTRQPSNPMDRTYRMYRLSARRAHGRRSTGRRTAVTTAAATVAAPLLLTAGAVTPAWAHGAPTDPVSRVSACSPEGGSQGSAACRAAVAANGAPFTAWDNMRVAGVNGRDREVVPDGQLCSGGLAGLQGARPGPRRLALDPPLPRHHAGPDVPVDHPAHRDLQAVPDETRGTTRRSP